MRDTADDIAERNCRRIFLSSRTETLTFAATELASYIQMMTGRKLTIEAPVQDIPDADGFLIQCPDAEASASCSDEFDIRLEKGLVVLRGNRPRSCLYAVYAYLEEQGVRFLRPGPDGEVVPKRRTLKRRIRRRERASHDHRCICIEGAVSLEHALAAVDWMAKHRMNEFQLQFESSLFFWRRWYSHELNPRFAARCSAEDRERDCREITFEESEKLDDLLIRELKKRDIDVHRMGHGWTSRALGVSARGWEKADEPVPAPKKDWVALVDGKRDWYHGIPANTELCYSNKEAFAGIVESVVDYAAAHNEADVLLFCLSDGTNNTCECADCARLTTSDWYAKLVNAISIRLEDLGLRTRVSFDSYVDTWHAPEAEHILDQGGRLIFMFAPFFRCYEHALADRDCLEDYPATRPAGGQTPVITGNRAYVQLLRQWQACCAADSFLCDYHFIRFHYRILDEMFVARRVHTDVVDLLPLGFNGMFSCQVLRAFYPTALGMTVMAAALWDRELPFGDIVESHLKAAFGPYAAGVRKYLADISAILKPTPDGHDHLLQWAKDQDQAQRAVGFIAAWEAKLTRMRETARSAVHKRSLDYLCHYNTLLTLVCEAAGAFAAGNLDDVRGKLEAATAFACDTEPDTHWVLDTWMLNHWHTERIALWQDGPKWFLKAEKH